MRAMKNALELAIEILGSQSNLGRALGLSQPYVWKWLNKGQRKVPAEYCGRIERATHGLVKCSDLRPDIFPICPHIEHDPPQKKQHEKEVPEGGGVHECLKR